VFDKSAQLLNFQQSITAIGKWLLYRCSIHAATGTLLSPVEEIMVKRVIFIGMALLLVATSASAKPYFSLGGMWVDLRDADIRVEGQGTRMSFDDGWGAFVAVGQQFELFRLEGEAAYRRNDIDGVGGTDIGGGKTEAMSGMVNAYLDFDMLQFRPFIGAGAGMARVRVDPDGIGSDRDNVFAYQGMIGVSFAMQPVGFDIGYRYFATEDPSFTTNLGRIRGEYETHNLYVAIRF
jgi:opacity protein-like surface antigen